MIKPSSDKRPLLASSVTASKSARCHWAAVRTAAQWQRADLLAVTELANSGRLSLDGLITHHQAPSQAHAAYETAFGDDLCLKMILDWRNFA